MKDRLWFVGLLVVLGNFLILRPVLAAAGVPPLVLWPIYLAVFVIGLGLQLRGMVLSHRRMRETRRFAEAYFARMEAVLTQFQEDRKTMAEDEALKQLNEKLNALKAPSLPI